MAYIEAHQALLTHRKTLRLGRLLNLDKYAVVGRLMALWWWALDNAPDGAINGADSDILADVMGWDGDPNELCAALDLAGFLERDGSDYRIHDWDDYAGKLMERRKANAKRQQDWRERHVTHDTDTPNAHVTVTSQSRNGANVTKRSIENHNHTVISDGEGESTEREIAPVAVATAARPQGPALALVKPTEDTLPQAKSGTKTPPTPAARPPKARSINPLWDALVVALGYEPTTRPARSNWGKAVKDLTEAGATPDEIALRAGRIVTRWGREYLTINALVTHWSEPGIGTDAPLSTAIRASPASADSGPRFVTADQFDPWKKTAATARGETR